MLKSYMYECCFQIDVAKAMGLRICPLKITRDWPQCHVGTHLAGLLYLDTKDFLGKVSEYRKKSNIAFSFFTSNFPSWKGTAASVAGYTKRWTKTIQGFVTDEILDGMEWATK